MRKEDIIYDEHDLKMQELQDRKKRRRRKWRIFRWSFFITAIVLGSMYFFSDYSKVKSLVVKNATFYSDDEILEKAGLSYNSRYLFSPGFYITWQLEKDSLIDSVEVSKNLDGAIIIDVKEMVIIGYTVKSGGAIQLLLANGKLIDVDQKYLSNVVLYPQIDGFKEKELPKLAKAFNQAKKKLPKEIISMISEIHPYSTSYDEAMVKLVMQDGNVIFSSYEGVSLISQYKKVLEYLDGNHVCLFIDESTNSIQKNKCP